MFVARARGAVLIGASLCVPRCDGWERCRWMCCMWFSILSTAAPQWRTLPPSLFSTESALAVISPSSRSSPQPCRVKAEQSGSDVSAALTSPHRPTDRERVIRGKTHMKGERPVFSGKAVRLHLNVKVSYASQAGKFHHRCMLGAENHHPSP